MKFGPIIVKDKEGNEIELRNAEPSDAQTLIDYLKITTAQTPYLIREPDEVTLTPEQEEAFIRSNIEADRELLLLAFENGKHIGNCSLMSIGNYRRYAHRCGVAIALYQAYWGRGIGKQMLETVLQVAKDLGYEQAELEVMSHNRQAVSLYEKLGFKACGTFPNNMKYADGSYDDALWMMKPLGKQKMEKRGRQAAHIIHPIPPLYDKRSRILILGSFPSVKSRETTFFYGHPQNRFWKVTASVLEEKVPQTIEEKRAFLLRNRIAVWDVIGSCTITGSSDASIRDVIPNDLSVILQAADIQQIYVNGKTAEKFYRKFTRNVTGREAVCLPSTSPANAAWSLEKLIDEWQCIRYAIMQ